MFFVLFKPVQHLIYNYFSFRIIYVENFAMKIIPLNLISRSTHPAIKYIIFLLSRFLNFFGVPTIRDRNSNSLEINIFLSKKKKKSQEIFA